MDVEVVILDESSEAFETFLGEQIKEFNNEHSPFHREARKPGSSVPLNIMVKSESGEHIGGLAASTYWGWLDIDNFYLPEVLRGEGLGATLLQQAEAIAVGRGCTRCFLTTFKFQARTFYEGQGYFVTGKLEDYPPGSTFYWMRKELNVGALEKRETA